MLGTEDLMPIQSVVTEILETNISYIHKIDILHRLKKYEGYNDEFSCIDIEIKKLKEKIHSFK